MLPVVSAGMGIVTYLGKKLFPKWGDKVIINGKPHTIDETTKFNHSYTITLNPDFQVTEDVECEVVKPEIKLIEDANK